MATRVRITRNPGDARTYQPGQEVTLPDPRAARLVASGCAVATGRTSALFPAMVEALRASTPAKRAVPPPKRPPVLVRLTTDERHAGAVRPAGSQVSVSESRAAMLIVEGKAEMPSQPTPRLQGMVAEFRQVQGLFGGRVAKAMRPA